MNVISRVNELLETSRTFCLATVISSSNKDIIPGTKTIVFDDGYYEGGTGDQAWDFLAGSFMGCLPQNKSSTVSSGILLA